MTAMMGGWMNGGGMERWTMDEWKDGQMDERTNGWKDGRMPDATQGLLTSTCAQIE